MGSPPPVGSKKVVLKFRSVRSIVIAPANTGRERRSNTAVMRTDHTNNGTESKFIVVDRMFTMVEMKLIAPRIEETPAKCNLKIVMSTDRLEWN